MAVPTYGLPTSAWPSLSLPTAGEISVVVFEAGPAVEYQVIVRDHTTGDKIATVTDFLSLFYFKKLGFKGQFGMQLDGDHPLIALLSDKDIVEVHRRDKQYGVDWYRDFVGLFRDEIYQTPQALTTYTMSGTSDLALLDWRRVAWFAGTSDRATFASQATETIMKTLVTYNITASATTGAGRLRNGAIANFTVTVQTDGTNGNNQAWNCAYDNLLDTLRELSKAGGGDFDLIYDSSGHAWEFRWYTGQRGVNRSSTVRFALNFDNMSSPRYEHRRAGERTAAIVAGQGEASDRDITIRTGDNYAADNDIEMLVNATHIDKGDTSGLQSAGDEKLKKFKALEKFTFKPVQTPGTLYGKAYCVDGNYGDLVTGIYKTVSQTFKITGVRISVANTGQTSETIRLDLETT